MQQQSNYRVVGSSPRVRGKLPIDLVTITADRIIPASAGQTSHLLLRPFHSPDHPRECGANDYSEVIDPDCDGSSPRVRGKHRGVARTRRQRRIIPASAGQTPLRAAYRCPNRDHPRECGANAWSALRSSLSAGSSPRVRGKLGGLRIGVVQGRIIPASAGQTPMCRLI